MLASRFDGSGKVRPSSSRWNLERLNGANQLWGSNGVAFGPDGRLYVAQFLAGQVSAVDVTTGEVEIVVPLDGPVQTPDDLAFGTDGTMYIADIAPSRVWRRTTDGEYVLVSDSVRQPNGITCVGDRLFVNEMRPGGRLFELFPCGGEPELLTGGLSLGNATGDGDVLQLATMTGEVHAYDPQRKTSRVRARGLGELAGIAVGSDGRVVVAAPAAGQVFALDGSDDVRVLADGLARPVGVAVDEGGTCYVTDDRLGQVLRLDDEGPVFVHDGLAAPQGIAFTGGALYVIEAGNRRLTRISLEDATSTIETEILAVGLPPGIEREEPVVIDDFAGRPCPFVDLAATHDGALLVGRPTVKVRCCGWSRGNRVCPKWSEFVSAISGGNRERIVCSPLVRGRPGGSGRTGGRRGRLRLGPWQEHREGESHQGGPGPD